MTIEAQIRELLEAYAEGRILIRKLLTSGPPSDMDGNLRLADAAVHLTNVCVTEIMAAMAMEVAEELDKASFDRAIAMMKETYGND